MNVGYMYKGYWYPNKWTVLMNEYYFYTDNERNDYKYCWFEFMKYNWAETVYGD